MRELIVNDMTSRRCEGVVTKAIKSVDAGAKVVIDLGTKVVSVESEAEFEDLKAALEYAGYPAKRKPA